MSPLGRVLGARSAGSGTASRARAVSALPPHLRILALQARIGNKHTQSILQRAVSDQTQQAQVAAHQAAHAQVAEEIDHASPIAKRFPAGISVAMALLPKDKDALAEKYAKGTDSLGEIVKHLGPELNDKRADVQKLRAAVQDHGGKRPTAEEASLLAEQVVRNDRTFASVATPFAKDHEAIGGDPAAPSVGKPLLYSPDDDPIAKLKQLSRVVGPLPGADDDGNIRQLSIFTHGWHTGVRLGKFGSGAGRFANAVTDLLTKDVNIALYACSAASGKDSFAEKVAVALAGKGHNVRVFGHEVAGTTEANPLGREFRASAGENVAHSALNRELVFPEDYRRKQIADIARALGVSPDVIERIFDAAARKWLVRAMKRIKVAPFNVVASYAMGYDPKGASMAMRAAWEQEGAEVIRKALPVALRPPAAGDHHSTPRPAPHPGRHSQEPVVF